MVGRSWYGGHGRAIMVWGTMVEGHGRGDQGRGAWKGGPW